MGLRLVKSSSDKRFQKTEFGLIPEDWEIREFEDVFEFLKTGSSSRSKLSADGDIFYIHYGDIHSKWSNRLDFIQDEIPKIKQEFVSSLPTLKDGDLIIADASEDYEGIGASIEVKNIGDREAVSGLHTLLLRAKEDAIIDGYRAYVTRIKPVKDSLVKISTGTTVFGVSKGQLKRVLIPFPKAKEEQIKIAKALSDIDELIHNLENLIEKKRLIRKGVMQELLTGKKRLPGYTKRWIRLKLKDISDITMGSSPLSRNYNRHGVGLPLIGGNADISERRSIARTFTTEITKVCEKDDILMTVRAPVGEIALATNKSCIGRGVCSIRALNKVDQKFIYYKLISLEPEWQKLEQGSTFTSANSDQIKNFELEIPLDPKEQSMLSNILHDLDIEINTLKNKLFKYHQIKNGMMQELLTGKTRLVNNKKAVSKKAEEKKAGNTHNWAINEAVVISTLVDKFGSDAYPLGRKRYTKFSYLLHRYKEKQAEGYLKKAAGPYNPSTKYGGPEKIAQQNGYIKKSKVGKYSGFVVDDNIDKALDYFKKWYGHDALSWLEQFRYSKNDELELWATVDMAIQDLKKKGIEASVKEIKALINDHKEWRPKLKRPVFSDINISKAISKTETLFNG